VESGEETEVAVKVVHPGLRQNLHRVSSSTDHPLCFWLLVIFVSCSVVDPDPVDLGDPDPDL
jgi:hypothetical protein